MNKQGVFDRFFPTLFYSLPRPLRVHGSEIQIETFFKHLFHYGQVVQNFGPQILQDTLKFKCETYVSLTQNMVVQYYYEPFKDQT
jgi:hypothetical protein